MSVDNYFLDPVGYMISGQHLDVATVVPGRFDKEVVVKNKLALVYVGTSQITTTNDFKTLGIS